MRPADHVKMLFKSGGQSIFREPKRSQNSLAGPTLGAFAGAIGSLPPFHATEPI
jgi:hypothetical protein